MISLPLLERYLRQKNHVALTQPLSDASMSTLGVVFPVLSTVDVARQLWSVYRNGFLHQATLPAVTHRGTSLPVGWLTYNRSTSITIEPDGSFCVQPRIFSQRIVEVIERDFAVFSGVAAGAPPLPVVARLDPVIIPSTYLRTRGGP